MLHKVISIGHDEYLYPLFNVREERIIAARWLPFTKMSPDIWSRVDPRYRQTLAHYRRSNDPTLYQRTMEEHIEPISLFWRGMTIGYALFEDEFYRQDTIVVHGVNTFYYYHDEQPSIAIIENQAIPERGQIKGVGRAMQVLLCRILFEMYPELPDETRVFMVTSSDTARRRYISYGYEPYPYTDVHGFSANALFMTFQKARKFLEEYQQQAMTVSYWLDHSTPEA